MRQSAVALSFGHADTLAKTAPLLCDFSLSSSWPDSSSPQCPRTHYRHTFGTACRRAICTTLQPDAVLAESSVSAAVSWGGTCSLWKSPITLAYQSRSPTSSMLATCMGTSRLAGRHWSVEASEQQAGLCSGVTLFNLSMWGRGDKLAPPYSWHV